MFLYVAFLILLFKQPFFFWLMCLRFVGSVPIIHVNRDKICRWNIKGRKDRPLRHFNAFLILVML